MPYERYSPYTLYKPTYLLAIESITESIPGIINSSSKLEVSRAQKENNEIPHQAKSAICQLNELRRGLTFQVAQYGPPHAPSFEAKVEIDGQIFVGTGKRIKEAKEAAARQALDALPLSSKAFWASRERCLSVTDSPYSSTAFVPLAIPVPPKLPFVQEISNHFEDLLHSHYRTLVPLLPVGQEHFQVMAGIVMTTGTRKEDAEVIVLTTGNKCITSLSLCARGLAVNDCHAEVIASRAFRLFLWNQIDLFLHSGNSGRSIFVWNENRSHLRLKSNVKFHFYINTAPCGDARNFNVPDNADPVSTVLIDRNPNRKSRGLLRVKVEEGEGSIPVPSTARENWSWEAITTKKARLCTMSCSDKLARWNVLGLQGALLSNFVEPIYMSSISIARKFHLEHLQRGLFGRLSSEINSRRLPIPFVFNQPLIGLPNRVQDDTYVKQSAPKYSLNWFRGCQKPEIVRTSSGKLYSGEVSRLCKAKFAERFIALSQTVCGADCKLVEATYAGLKAKAHTYQESKHTLYNSFEEAGLGNWVRKPPEQDAFLVS